MIKYCQLMTNLCANLLKNFLTNIITFFRYQNTMIYNRQRFLALCCGLILISFTFMSGAIASPLIGLVEPANIALTTGNNRNFVSQAVERVGPAVVRIDTEKTITRQNSPVFNDPFFEDFFGRDFGRDFGNAMPRTQIVRGQGSGFIIDANGTILTNAHVVDEADRVTVTLNDGRKFSGEVKGKDQLTDLAVVKITDRVESLPVVSLGDSDQVRVGDWAIAVGNPLGFNNTVTLGIISTLKRSSAAVGIPDKRLDFIQTDAAINPGNSGGPLLNEQGEVIGINTAIRADAMGIGFAIPVNKAKEIKDILVRGGSVSHPFIGIQMVSITPDIAKENNQNPNSPLLLPEVAGVLITRVLPNTPAATAGLRSGDVIVRVNRQAITEAEQLQKLVESSGVGAKLDLEIMREGRSRQLTVTTGEMSQSS
jgi:Do/DeqQ family serine protease